MYDINGDEGITNTTLLTWYVDSITSAHICKNKEIFTKYHVFDNPCLVFLGNGAHVMAIAIKNLKISGGIIQNVLHVPLIKKKLLSIDALEMV
mgnify:CR=1 FL=1